MLLCLKISYIYLNKDQHDPLLKTQAISLTLYIKYSIIAYGSIKEIVCHLSNNLVQCNKQNYDYGGRTVNVSETINIKIDRIDGLISHLEHFSLL